MCGLVEKMIKNQITAYYLKGYYSPDSNDPGIREAYGRKNLYENAPVFNDENLLITGNLSAAVRNEIVSNAVSAHYMNQENIDSFLSQETLDYEEKKTLINQLDAFKKTCLFEFRHTLATAEERLVEESGAARAQGYNGHFGYDFGFVLNRGFENVKKYITDK